MVSRATGHHQHDPVVQDTGLRIYLLGDFRVVAGDVIVPASAWKLRKAGHLVKLLALSPGYRVHREQVMEALWPDRTPASAANNLRYALHVARKLLTATNQVGQVLRFDGPMLALASGMPIWTDAGTFEHMATEALEHGSAGDIYAALAMFSGELLPDDEYEEWVAEHRRALHTLRHDLYLRLARLTEEQGALVEAVAALQQATLLEPAHEPSHLQLIRLFSLLGQPHRAIRQYHQLEEHLRHELDAEPSFAARTAFEQLTALADMPAVIQTDDLPARETTPTSLPAATSTFVGREHDLSQLSTLLKTSRLMTLTGPGGIGKTRLSLELATRTAGRFPDGVWFVELAPLSDASLVPEAVMSAIQVHDRAIADIDAALVNHLRGKEALLVLDNCEHLAGACADMLAMLLGHCPRLRAIATSRQRLGVPGEVLWNVAPMAAPSGSSPVEDLPGYDAVALFLDRARLADPQFTLTAGNAAAVSDICRQVSGIPLAIELATARLRMLSPAQIGMRLEDSLQLLTDGNRTAPPRQQTLRGAIDWSYAQLSDEERMLFARLSVFAGGWSLEAVESICSDVSDNVLALLGTLIDKSLVTVERDGEQTRYTLLEPLRQYAAERLLDDPDSLNVHERHAGLFLALAERSVTHLSGTPDPGWLERIEQEHDNIRAALQWSLSDGDIAVGMRLASALWWFWYARGHVTEGRRWLQRLLHAPAPSTDPAIRAAALNAAGNLASKQGDYSAAREAFEASLALRRGAGEPRAVAASLNNLGFVAYNLADYDRAAELFHEGLQVERSIGLGPGAAHAMANLGMLAYQSGDLDEAGRQYQASLDLFTRLDYEQGAVVSLCYLGNIALAEGRLAVAAGIYQESLTRAQRVNARRAVALALSGLGLTYTRQDNLPAARTALAGSLRVWQEIDNQHGTASCLEGLAELAVFSGNFQRALTLGGAAERLREEIGAPQISSERARIGAWKSRAECSTSPELAAQYWLDGRRMTLAETVSLALGSQDIIPDTAPSAASDSPLTPREGDVARLVAEGLTNREIAVRLGIGQRTVNTHVHHILKKLGLASRAQIAVWTTVQQQSSVSD